MKSLFLTILIAGTAALASAQVPTSGNIFAGYSYSGGDVDMRSPGQFPASHSASLNGWEGSLEGKLLPWVGIVADLSGQYGSHALLLCPAMGITGGIPCTSANINARRYTAMFGPRLSVSVGKFTPFAEALVGAAHVTDNGGGHSTSDTSLATAIGGGLDYKIIRGIAWRLQGDELHTRFFGSSQDHLRLSTGLVLRF